MAQAPSHIWVCGPWATAIARRPCPYSGSLRLVCASVHAPSQYFPVPLRPLWLDGPFFMKVVGANPSLGYLDPDAINFISHEYSRTCVTFGANLTLSCANLCKLPPERGGVTSDFLVGGATLNLYIQQ
ncbi:hypothetical protein BDV98DRAFT_625862 [Pterulicium gracile]|uniref:Uncharacterized protein n=1 Tax=Pterulicium gracile TaxID=1884261 RepID=A0A5C3QCL1_9AGAR|nr:hypothetical protein BDV98DRAFT_625862 [Pterula gracilis]